MRCAPIPGYQGQSVTVPDMYGTFGARTLKFIRDLGRRIVLQSGDSLAAPYLNQHLAVAVQRGSAALINGTMGLLAD